MTDSARTSKPYMLSAARRYFNLRPALLLLMLPLLSFTMFAQTPNGSVQGTVVDQNGAVIAGTQIVLRDVSGVERVVVTDADGQFIIGNLTAGDYALTTNKQGFLAAQQAVTVKTDSTLNLNLTLTPADVSESVNVNAETSLAVDATLKLPGTLRETPRSLTIINAERIREQSFKSVPDVLAYTPNTTVNSYRSGGYHFYARGYRMAPDDTRVDGFAGINTSGGFGASLFGIEQAVLLRGPAGLLYGSAGAPGGLINLVTKKPQETRFTQIDVRGGSYAGNGVGFGERGFGGIDVDSTGSITDSNRVLYRALFTVENQNYFTNNVLDRNRYANGSLTFKLDKEGRYTFTPLVQWTRFNRPAGGGIVVSPSSSLTTNDGSSRLNTNDISRPDVNLSSGGRVDETLMTGFDVRATPTDKLRFNAAYRFIDFDYSINQFTPQVSGNTQINQLLNSNTVSRVQSKSDNYQRNHSFDINGSYELRAAGWWRNTTQVGVYNRYLTTRTTTASGMNTAQSPINIYTGIAPAPLVDRLTLAWATPNRTSYLNGYVQNRTSLDNNRFIITLGLGYGRNAVNDVERNGAFIPNAGFVFNATQNISLYASYAESFNPSDALVQDINGNINPFSPTKGKNYETGAKFDIVNRKLSSTVSLFYNTIDNALVQSGVNDFNPNGVRFFAEAGTRRSRGIEVTTDYQPIINWRITGAVSFLDAIYTGEAPPSAIAGGTVAIPNSRAEKSPRFSYNLWNRYDRNEGLLRGFGAGLGLIWQAERLGSNGARTRNAPDPLVLPAFTRVDGALYYRLNEKIDFSMNIENVFDRLIFVNASVGSNIEIAAPRTFTFRTGYRF